MKDFLEVIKEGEDSFNLELRAATKRIANFNEKFGKFLELVVNKKGYARHKRDYLLKEAASTSDFPLLMGTVLDRSLIAKYQMDTADWEAYIARGTQSDFRPSDAIGVYGLEGQLQVVPQRGEYKQDAQLGEGKMPQIVLSKYGRIFGLGWETLINDDLGGFNDIAERLNKAAKRTEMFQATKLIAAATGPHATLFGNAIAHPIDGVVINNKGVLPLTTDNLAAVCNLMRRQKDSDGEPIIIEGFELVVPPALELTAYTILNSMAHLISGGDGQAGAKYQLRPAKNPLDMFTITPHTNVYLPIIDVSAGVDKTWYLFAKRSSGVAAKMNFLRGHETPELCMKNPNKVSTSGAIINPMEGNFEEDTMWWRVRHVLGGVQYDPRMGYASVAP
jgi:hypothetical protein